MPHRDEVLALQARLEAQTREIDDAKAENALLRAAHAQRTHEAERLRRELAATRERGLFGDEDPSAADPRNGEPGIGDDEQRARMSMCATGARRGFGLAAAVMAATAMGGAMLVAMHGPCVGRHRHARAAIPVVTHVERTGQVAEGSSSDLVATGDRCTVEVIPTNASVYDCRVVVRCGEHTLYGTTEDTGYVRCGGRSVVRDAELTVRDGDPAMALDVAEGRVVVEEQLGLGMERVVIALDPLESPPDESPPDESPPDESPPDESPPETP